MVSMNRTAKTNVKPGGAQNGALSEQAAPASSYRGEKKKRYDSLVEMREQLFQQLRTLSASSLTSTRQPGEELADIGSDNFSREMGLALMTEEGRVLSLIDEALERLDQGGYGVCIDCGGKISPLRLDAIPYAKLCVDCKGARERNEQDAAPEPTTPIAQQDELTE
jgi:DnaK suppressor protein